MKKAPRTYPIEITDIMRDRIRTLTKSSGKTYCEICVFLPISPEAYKNILRQKNGTKTMRTDTVEKLAEYFDCTQDYLMGESEDPHLDKYGKHVVRPFLCEPKDKAKKMVFNYLESNSALCNDLYYLFCVIPEKERTKLTDSLSSIINVFKDYTFLNEEFAYSKQEMAVIRNSFSMGPDSISYTKSIYIMAKANELEGKHQYKRALYLYFQIIYAAVSINLRIKYIARDAFSKIQLQKNTQGRYPNNHINLYNNAVQINKDNYTFDKENSQDKKLLQDFYNNLESLRNEMPKGIVESANFENIVQ